MSVAIEVGEKENIEDALKRFKKKVLRSNILREMRARQEYVKPSVKRKLKSKNARARARAASRPVTEDFFSTPKRSAEA